MTVTLHKCSLPNVWRKDFGTLSEAVTELRNHICEECLIGPSLWIGPNGTIMSMEEMGYDYEEPVVDTIYEGVRYECRDASILLGTSCGCEFELEGDHGLWEEN